MAMRVHPMSIHGPGGFESRHGTVWDPDIGSPLSLLFYQISHSGSDDIGVIREASPSHESVGKCHVGYGILVHDLNLK